MSKDIILLVIYTLFISLLFYILKRSGKNVEYKVFYGMFRIGSNLSFLNKISKSIFAKIFEILSIPSGFLIMFFAIFLILISIKNKLLAVAPLIPGIEIYGIKIPFFEAIIAIFLSVLVHELAHALLVIRNNLAVKSYGVFFLGPFLGAFVEPSEEVYKIDKIKQIAIFHAGIFANILLAILSIFLWNTFYYYLASSGNIAVIILGKVQNASVENITGERLLYINQFKINTLGDIGEALKHFKPGDRIEIITNVSRYDVILSEINGRPFIGLYFREEVENDFYKFILNLLFWIYIISLGIGLANALPIFILDGGQSMRTLLEMIIKKKETANKLYIIISYLVLSLILVNIIVSL